MVVPVLADQQEDLLGAMDDRDEWRERERVREICNSRHDLMIMIEDLLV